VSDGFLGYNARLLDWISIMSENGLDLARAKICAGLPYPSTVLDRSGSSVLSDYLKKLARNR